MPMPHLKATEEYRAALARIETHASLTSVERVLHQFVLTYANVDVQGDCLARDSTLELILFTIWIRACEELGIDPSDPSAEPSRG